MIKTWFITGASRGIGAEIAKAALAAGDNVVATGRDLARLETLFGCYGERVLSVQLDVAQEGQAALAVEAALRRFGRIDVAVNNAGYGQLGPFEENDVKAVERQFATNVFGVFHVCRAVLPVMRGQRSGHIFNISSIAGVAGMGGAALYCSAKFAIEGFSEALAQEVARKGVTVNTVSPGYLATKMVMAVPEDVRNSIIAGIPVGRLGKPEEIAALVTFIASEAAGFMTGSNVAMNGGQHMY